MRIHRQNSGLLGGGLRQDTITILLLAVGREQFRRFLVVDVRSHERASIHDNVGASKILRLMSIVRGQGKLVPRVLPVVIRRVNALAVHPFLRLLDLHLGYFHLGLRVRLWKL